MSNDQAAGKHTIASADGSARWKDPRHQSGARNRSPATMALGCPDGLDGSHVGSPRRGGEGREMVHQTWTNQFFVEQGLFNLKTAHALAVQSSRR